MTKDTIGAITEAIERSVSSGECITVHIKDDVDICDIIAEILCGPWDGDVDYADEGAGRYDVWGWTDQTPEGEQEWRLTLVLKCDDNPVRE